MIQILLADDENDIIDTFKDAFQSAFPEVNLVTAHDGMDAYRKARNQSFSLICTDFKMPKLNGAELIRALREQVHNQETPIFLISGFSATQLKMTKEFKNLTFFEKPFDIKEIIEQAKIVIANKTVAHEHPNKKLHLDVNFINPFIEATQLVLTTFGSLKEIKPLKPYLLKKGDKLGVEISGVIPMVSPLFKGNLAVGFPKTTFIAVASALLGETHTEISTQIEDAAAELANIIYGQTKTKLNENGYELGLARPSIVRGHDHSISPPDGQFTIVVPFESSAGPFYIQISI